MIKIILFLASLEKKVSKVAKSQEKSSEASWQPKGSTYDATVGQYQAIKKRSDQKTLPAPAKSRRGLYDMVKGFVANAYSNTVGYPIALYQNRQTAKYIRKNPDVKKRVHIMVPGFFQNIGSHYKQGKLVKQQGGLPYHIHGGHGIATLKPLEQRAETFYKGMEYFKKKTGLNDKDFQKIPKTYRGHSAGADLGAYIAGDERVKKYGINKVVNIAGTGGSMEIRTPAQKLFEKAFPGLKEDDPRYSKRARQTTINLNLRRPKVPVYSVYGSNDQLVPRDKTVPYQHHTNEAIIYHPRADHFGTSGQNQLINQAILDLDKIQEKQKKHRLIAYYVNDPQYLKKAA